MIYIFLILTIIYMKTNTPSENIWKIIAIIIFGSFIFAEQYIEAKNKKETEQIMQKIINNISQILEN